MLEAAAGTQLEELGQEDAGAGAVLESMLVGDGPVEAAGAFAAAGEPAGAEPVVLDEAVSPVAGRRFNRA
jgi:hypothetical protein